MFWLAVWYFGSCFNVLARTLMFWRFDVLACALMFWLTLWHFGVRFDVSARVWMFRLALGPFSSRLDFLARAWTFWLALGRFGSCLDVSALAWTFSLHLDIMAFLCWKWWVNGEQQRDEQRAYYVIEEFRSTQRRVLGVILHFLPTKASVDSVSKKEREEFLLRLKARLRRRYQPFLANAYANDWAKPTSASFRFATH